MNKADIIENIKNLSIKSKVIFLVLAVLSLTGIVMLFSWSQRPDYQVLFSNLAESDTGLIVQKLKEMKVPYKIEFGSILVPSDSVYDLRLQLATQGLPQGGGIGFEIFDKTSFGTTDFVNKINYRRALQGELARTIASLAEIDQVRVHLSIPEKSLFVTEEDKPGASVFVKLKPGKILTPRQVEGIVHLVSSSIDGLLPENVTIIDNNGHMLTQPNDEVIALNNGQYEYKHNYEKDKELRILNILEPVAGKGKVKAKVNAEIDFTQIESTEEKFDPDGQVVRSEQNSSEKEITSKKGGVPGVVSNIPNKDDQAPPSSQNQSDKKTETINYEISKLTKHIKNSYGGIKRLSAAVVVDGKYIPNKDGTTPQYTSRTDEELKYYEDLAKKAIGYSTDRGDEITVVNMPFEAISQEEFSEIQNPYLPTIMAAIKSIVLLLIVIFFFLFAVKPLIKVLSNSQVKQKYHLPQTVAELEMSMKEKNLIETDMAPKEISAEINKKDAGKDDKNPVNQHVIEWAKNNPQQAAVLIKGWLK